MNLLRAFAESRGFGKPGTTSAWLAFEPNTLITMAHVPNGILTPAIKMRVTEHLCAAADLWKANCTTQKTLLLQTTSVQQQGICYGIVFQDAETFGSTTVWVIEPLLEQQQQNCQLEAEKIVKMLRWATVVSPTKQLQHTMMTDEKRPAQHHVPAPRLLGFLSKTGQLIQQDKNKEMRLLDRLHLRFELPPGAGTFEMQHGTRLWMKQHELLRHKSFQQNNNNHNQKLGAALSALDGETWRRAAQLAVSITVSDPKPAGRILAEIGSAKWISRLQDMTLFERVLKPFVSPDSAEQKGMLSSLSMRKSWIANSHLDGQETAINLEASFIVPSTVGHKLLLEMFAAAGHHSSKQAAVFERVSFWLETASGDKSSELVVDLVLS